jgi:hypothetical protein
MRRPLDDDHPVRPASVPEARPASAAEGRPASVPEARS